MPELTPEQKQRLQAEVASYAKSGASDDEIRRFASSLAAGFEKHNDKLAIDQSVSGGQIPKSQPVEPTPAKPVAATTTATATVGQPKAAQAVVGDAQPVEQPSVLDTVFGGVANAVGSAVQKSRSFVGSVEDNTVDAMGFKKATVRTKDGKPFVALVDKHADETHVAALQQRIASGEPLNEDVEMLRQLNKSASGEPMSKNAVDAYIKEGAAAGKSEEAIDQLTNRNNTVSQSLSQLQKFFPKYSVDQILSDPNAAKDFISYFQSLKAPQQSEADMAYGRDAMGMETGFVDDSKYNARPDVQQYKNQLKLFGDVSNNLNTLVAGHFAGKVAKGEMNKDQALLETMKTTDPSGFRLYNTAADTGEATQNPFRMISSLVDDLTGHTDANQQVLNAHKGQAEGLLNNALSEYAIIKGREASLSKDPEVAKQAVAAAKNIDSDYIYKYPTLVESSITSELTDYISQVAGNKKGSNGEDLSLKIFGDKGSKYEYAKQYLQQKGYLTNPKTKDIAANILVNILAGADKIGESSYLGSMGSSFAQPFTDFFKGVGDLTGVRGDQTLAAERTKENLFPEVAPNLTATTETVRNVANTTANVMGQAIAQYALGGLGRAAGLGKEAAMQVGFWSSGALPSYDQAYKDAMEFTDNVAGRNLYALAVAAANGASEHIFPEVKLLDIPGVKSELASMATKFGSKDFTRELTNEALGKAKNAFVKYATKFGKNVGQEAIEEVATQTFSDLNRIIWGDKDMNLGKLLENGKDTFIQTVTGMPIIGLWGAHGDVKRERGSTFKSAVYNAGLYHDEAQDALLKGLQNGAYDQPTYNTKMAIVNTARTAVGQLNQLESATGRNLSLSQRQVYVANLTAEALAEKQLEQAKGNDILESQLQAKINNLRSQREAIFGQDQQFDETLTPVDSTIVPEKPIQPQEAAQEAPPAVPLVSDAIGHAVVYNGVQGTLEQDGQTLIFRHDELSPEGRVVERELGNAEKLGGEPMSVLSLALPEQKHVSIEGVNIPSLVDVNEGGNFIVTETGKAYTTNKHADPMQSIIRDENGQVKEVHLHKEDTGGLRKFRGQLAQDLAYQITLQKITNDNATRQRFEEFINTDPAATAALDSAAVSTDSQAEPNANPQQVQSVRATTDAGTVADLHRQPVETNDQHAARLEKLRQERASATKQSAPNFSDKEVIQTFSPTEKKQYLSHIEDGNISAAKAMIAEKTNALNEKVDKATPLSKSSTTYTKEAPPTETKDNKQLDDVKKLVQALPNTKITVHDTQASYSKAVAAVSDDAQHSNTSGFYINKGGNEIHINGTRTTSETIFHEGAHPLLDQLAESNPKAIDNLYDQLEFLAPSIQSAAQAIQFSQADIYDGNETQKKKEAIVQFLALAADGKVQYPVSLATKIKSFIQDLLNKFGLSYQFKEGISDSDNIHEFARKFSQAIRYGRAIDVRYTGVADMTVKGDEKSDKPLQLSNAPREGFSRSEGFVDKVSRAALKDFAKKTITVTGADRLMTGNLKLPDGREFNAKGGWGYPAETGNVWASAGDAVSGQIVNRLNDTFKKDGVAHLGIRAMTEEGVSSNYTFLRAATEFVQAAINSGKLSKKDVISRVNEIYENKGMAKVKFKPEFKNVSKENIGQAILDAFKPKTSKDKATFDDRRIFVQSLIGGANIKSDSVWGGVPSTKKLIQLLSDPSLDGVRSQSLVAVVKITSPVQFRQTSDEKDGATYHESYPFVIEQTDGKAPQLFLLDGAYNIEDAVPHFIEKTGDTVSLGDYNDVGEYLRKFSGGAFAVQRNVNVSEKAKPVTKAQFSASQRNTEVGKHDGVSIFQTTDAQKFHNAISDAVKNRANDGSQVEVKSTADYQKILDEGGKLFVSADGMFGGFVDKDGYMGSLFKNPAANTQGVAKTMQDIRVKEGGRFFDAYGTHIEQTYIKNGFVPVARVPFDESQAPAGWESTTLKTRPDVVFFAHNPTAVAAASVGDGKRFDNWQAASDYTQQYLKTNKPLQVNKTGATQGFFSDVVTGKSDKFKAQKEWTPLLSFSDAQQAFKTAYDKFKGNFDTHIATSIPTFRELQVKVGNAVLKSLSILPTKVNNQLASIKDKYIQDKNLPKVSPVYNRVSQSLFKSISDYHTKVEDDRQNPEMTRSYRAFLDETKEQYQYLIDNGYVLEPYLKEGEPYGVNSEAVRKDVTENKHLYYLRSRSATGEADQNESAKNYMPFESTGIQINGDDVLFNDLFRAVHDVFGHVLANNTFSTQGELNAYHTHSPMYSQAAQKALFLETVVYNAYYAQNGKYAPRKIYDIPQRFMEETNRRPLVYDIGGSEGGFVKAVTQLSGGTIESVNLDVNPDMKDAHEQKPVAGSTFVMEAFHEGYTDESTGVTYPRHNPETKADVVHESMVFQFITPEREQFIKEIKDNYLRPDGVVMLEEKLIPESEEEWRQNEEKKDEYKRTYYPQEAIAAKSEQVLVGMKQNQTADADLQRVLADNFKYVYQYWDSGNFKGYLATNNKAKGDQLIKEIGNTQSQFTTRPMLYVENGEKKTNAQFSAATQSSFEERRQQLRELKSLGILSDEEFDASIANVDFKEQSANQKKAAKTQSLGAAIHNIGVVGTGEKKAFGANETLAEAGFSQKGRPPQYEVTTIASMVEANVQFIRNLNDNTDGEAVHQLLAHYQFDENQNVPPAKMDVSNYNSSDYRMVNVLLSYLHTQPLSELGISPEESALYKKYLQKLTKKLGNTIGKDLNTAKFNYLNNYNLIDSITEAAIDDKQAAILDTAKRTMEDLFTGTQQMSDEELLAPEDEDALAEDAKKTSDITKLYQVKERLLNAIPEERSRKIVERIEKATKLTEEKIRDLLNSIKCD